MSQKIRVWLRARFGLVVHPAGIPTSGRDAKNFFELEPDRAQDADAAYIAFLAGVLSLKPQVGAETDVTATEDEKAC